MVQEDSSEAKILKVTDTLIVAKEEAQRLSKKYDIPFDSKRLK